MFQNINNSAKKQFVFGLPFGPQIHLYLFSHQNIDF